MELYVGVDVHFCSIPMPYTVNGFLTEHKDNYYIVINSNISVERQRKAIKHELDHLVNGDLDREESVSEIERGMD